MKKLEDGKTKSLSAENNARAARFLGVNSFWLATGEETMLEADQASSAAYRSQDHADIHHVGEAVTAYIGQAWPFMHIKPEQYARLSERQKGIIEGCALGMLRDQNEVKSGSARAA